VSRGASGVLAAVLLLVGFSRAGAGEADVVAVEAVQESAGTWR
jgi:hypothetical protein